MKNLLLFGFTSFLALSLLSCKKNNTTAAASSTASTVSFTIDGDGFSGQAASINGVKGLGSNGGFYSSGDKTTSVQIGDRKTEGDNDANSFDLTVQGNATGSFKFDEMDIANKNNLVLSLTHAGTVSIYNTAGANGSGSLQITSYGSKGSAIEGTFSGSMINEITHKTVTITNGYFQVPHIADF